MSSEDARADARLGCSRYLSTDAPPGLKQTLLGDRVRYSPDRSFDTVHVRIDLSVDLRAKTVSAVCATTVAALAKRVDRLNFQAAGMRVLGARLGDRTIRHTHVGDALTLHLHKPLRAGQEATVSIRYKIARPTTGLHFVSPGPERRSRELQMWSQGQPEDSHYWFPCHDAPHEKATTEVVATVPEGFTAVSNGVLVSKRKAPGGRTFHWRMRHPHSLYLVSIAVGRFAEIRERWENVELSYFCQKGRQADARRGFAKTAAAMGIFSKAFGVAYPYEKYAQVAVAEFPGGMENTTCTTQTDACLLSESAALDVDLDTLVAHELAHHWFGNLVTCRDWSHAWLNEGFATYSETIFTELHKGRDQADFDLERNRNAYIYEDANRYRRAIVHEKYKYPWVLFDRHLYEKGGWVLHMLRFVLGEEDWARSIQTYLNRNRDKSVETSDLILAVEESTGKNLRYFFDQWVFMSGYPSYEVRCRWESSSKRATVRIRQTHATDGGTPLFRMPAALRFTGAQGRWEKEFTETVSAKEHEFRFKLPGEPAMIEFDPEHRLLKKLDFRKPRALWLEQLRRSRTGLGRSQAAWQVAEWGDEAAVRALEETVRRDAFWGTAAEAARALGSIRTDSAFRALKRLITARHPKVRRAVVQGLSHFHSPECARLLRPFLTRDPSLNVRAEAARALGAQRDPKLIAELRKGLGLSSYWDILATGALQGLTGTLDPRVLPLLMKAARPPTPYPLRGHAIHALSRFAAVSDKALQSLYTGLASSDERIVLASISALGAVGDLRSVDSLRKLRDRHTDTRVKTYADEALVRILGEAQTKEKDK